MTELLEIDSPAPADPAAWKAIVAKYQRPDNRKATWQLVSTLAAYLGGWAGLFATAHVGWWLTLPLILLTGALLVRLFIIFHDCGHGSFFTSSTANDVVGFVTGVLTFTPYYHWRGEHAIHHGTTGNLERRGIGDVWTMTVQEYLEASRWKRFAYRLARNPFVLFVLAPLVLFVVLQRWTRAGASPRERRSVWMTNVALLVMTVTMSAIFGIMPYVLLQLAVLLLAGSVGMWLFYLQHQFEDAYWERGDDWAYAAAALRGSSFFKLPRILQWFSGNIGFHHIHHLSSRIPNYNLQKCHESDPLFEDVRPMTLLGSLKSLGLRLWDESSKKLIGFRELARQRRQTRDKDGAAPGVRNDLVQGSPPEVGGS